MEKPIFPPKEYGVSPTPFSSSGEYKTQLDTLQASKGPSMNDVRTVKREGGKKKLANFADELYRAALKQPSLVV